MRTATKRPQSMAFGSGRTRFCRYAVTPSRVGDLASAAALRRAIRAATIGSGTLDLTREALMQQLESVTGNILETHRAQREAPDTAAITHHDADRAELGVVGGRRDVADVVPRQVARADKIPDGDAIRVDVHTAASHPY